MNKVSNQTKVANGERIKGVRLSYKALNIQMAVFIACTAAVPHLAYAVTFTVNSTTDAVDAIPGDGACATVEGACTLRAAIQETNALAERDVIQLPAGKYKLTITGPREQAAATGDLNINDHLAITGAGAVNTVIDGGVCPDANDPTCTSDSVASDDDRVVSILNQGVNPIVNISGLTIQNGGGISVNGGGIFISEGSSLSLTNCIVRENKSRQFGGGISNAGFLQIFQTTISDNTLPIRILGGQTASGGGIFNFGRGVIQIDQSTISGNEAARGGGIRNAGGRLDITNSTISGNQATARGGGIMNFGIADIAFSTITANEANRQIPVLGPEDRFGGGIYNVAALDEGVPSTVSLGNTILAKNTDNRSRFDRNFSPDCFSVDPGFFTSFRGNLVGILNSDCNMRDTIFGAPPLFDMIGTEDNPLDPGLLPLANNGGPTQTHALRSDSPAVDQGTGVTSATFFDCPATDQRGFTRPVDGDDDGTADCDVGAYEFGATVPQIVLEAEDLRLDTYLIEDNSAASGGRLISLRMASGDTGSASTEFSGPSGSYDIVVGYLDETDGVAELALQVNGRPVDSWVLDQDLGSDDPVKQTFTERTIRGVVLETGDTLTIVGSRNGGEWARVDFVRLLSSADSR
jgi:CSLREA domain-containing protein